MRAPAPNSPGASRAGAGPGRPFRSSPTRLGSAARHWPAATTPGRLSRRSWAGALRPPAAGRPNSAPGFARHHRTGMRPSQCAYGAWWPRRPGSCWCQARCLFTIPDEFSRLFREGTHSPAWRKPVSIKVVPTFTDPPACARRANECLFSRATELIRYGGSERTRTHQQDKRDEGLGIFQPGQHRERSNPAAGRPQQRENANAHEHEHLDASTDGARPPQGTGAATEC